MHNWVHYNYYYVIVLPHSTTMQLVFPGNLVIIYAYNKNTNQKLYILLSTDYGGWNSSGCNISDFFTEYIHGSITCSCNHAGNFAIRYVSVCV